MRRIARTCLSGVDARLASNKPQTTPFCPSQFAQTASSSGSSPSELTQRQYSTNAAARWALPDRPAPRPVATKWTLTERERPQNETRRRSDGYSSDHFRRQSPNNRPQNRYESDQRSGGTSYNRTPRSQGGNPKRRDDFSSVFEAPVTQKRQPTQSDGYNPGRSRETLRAPGSSFQAGRSNTSRSDSWSFNERPNKYLDETNDRPSRARPQINEPSNRRAKLPEEEKSRPSATFTSREEDPEYLPTVSEDRDVGGKSRKHEDKRHKGGLSNSAYDLSGEPELEVLQTQQQKKPKREKKKKKMDVYIPSVVTVTRLAYLLNVKRELLQEAIEDAGMGSADYDRVLGAEDASLLALEFDKNPIVDDGVTFDLQAEPIPQDPQNHPVRPPVITIMGHVDHGKTTLLDTLRSSSVAANESGGITQHIGAFSVPLKSLPLNVSDDHQGPRTITFLDTPGHAAFSEMRARGANATDIIVLVVAADDGVMPQTREVIELAKKDSRVQLVVAINKCDKPGVDIEKIKLGLLQEGVQLECMGGDVPSVEVSGLTGQGLDQLVETLAAMAELADLRAERDIKPHGHVLEARKEKGKGCVATVLVTRGVLKNGDHIAAGNVWAKVRTMVDCKGAPIDAAYPGTPVVVCGWKDLPVAGDEVLGSSSNNGAAEVKRAVDNRIRIARSIELMGDVVTINEKRSVEKQKRQEELKRKEDAERRGHRVEAVTQRPEHEAGPKELRLIVKVDVSGSMDAVIGSISHIGNQHARVSIVNEGIGKVNESDIDMAVAAGAHILGFNVDADPAIKQIATQNSVNLHLESIIYKLIDTVTEEVTKLLPPVYEYPVLGEGVVQQKFEIALKGKNKLHVAGCRVTNGVFEKAKHVRVIRNGVKIFEGKVDHLKHHKKDVSEIRKGMECGLATEGFTEFMPEDIIQTFDVIEKPGKL